MSIPLADEDFLDAEVDDGDDEDAVLLAVAVFVSSDVVLPDSTALIWSVVASGGLFESCFERLELKSESASCGSVRGNNWMNALSTTCCCPSTAS